MFRDMPEQDSIQLDPLLGTVWLWDQYMNASPVGLHEAKPVEAISARTGGLGDSADASGSAQPLCSILSHHIDDSLSSFWCHCASRSCDRADQSQNPHLFLNISP